MASYGVNAVTVAAIMAASERVLMFVVVCSVFCFKLFKNFRLLSGFDLTISRYRCPDI